MLLETKAFFCTKTPPSVHCRFFHKLLLCYRFLSGWKQRLSRVQRCPPGLCYSTVAFDLADRLSHSERRKLLSECRDSHKVKFECVLVVMLQRGSTVFCVTEKFEDTTV